MLSISVNYFRVSEDGKHRLSWWKSGGRKQAEAEQSAEDSAEEAGGPRVARRQEVGEAGDLLELQGGPLVQVQWVEEPQPSSQPAKTRRTHTHFNPIGPLQDLWSCSLCPCFTPAGEEETEFAARNSHPVLS